MISRTIVQSVRQQSNSQKVELRNLNTKDYIRKSKGKEGIIVEKKGIEDKVATIELFLLKI